MWFTGILFLTSELSSQTWNNFLNRALGHLRITPKMDCFQPDKARLGFPLLFISLSSSSSSSQPQRLHAGLWHRWVFFFSFSLKSLGYIFIRFFFCCRCSFPNKSQLSQKLDRKTLIVKLNCYHGHDRHAVDIIIMRVCAFVWHKTVFQCRSSSLFSGRTRRKISPTDHKIFV